MTLYNCRAFPHYYTITKFDADLNPVATYKLEFTQAERPLLTCNCAAGSHGRVCKHRRMLPLFVEKSRQNTGWMYDHELAEWREFVGPHMELREPTSGYIPFGD